MLPCCAGGEPCLLPCSSTLSPLLNPPTHPPRPSCLRPPPPCRATGNYDIVSAVKHMRERKCKFRILGLSATPGADGTRVQVCCCCCCLLCPACCWLPEHAKPAVLLRAPGKLRLHHASMGA